MELERDIDRYLGLKQEIESIGEERLERCLNLFEKLREAFDEHRETAVGHGDFESYIHVQEVLAEVEEELESIDDIHKQELFSGIIDALDHRTIKNKHFAVAEDLMDEIEEDAENLLELRELRQRMETALESNKKAIKKKKHRKNKLREHINRIENLPDVDITEIQSNIERYNTLVEQDFQEFKQRNALEVLEFMDEAEKKPLLDIQTPDELDIELLESSDLGDKNVDDLLEISGYSEAKLSHFTDEPSKLKRSIPKRWLMEIDSNAFQINRDEDEDELRFRLPEIRRTIREFADEETMKELRGLERQVKKGSYSEMKEVMNVRKHTENGEVEEMKSEAKELESDISYLRDINSEISDALGS